MKKPSDGLVEGLLVLGKSGREDLNLSHGVTQPLQNGDNSAAECDEKPLEGSSQKQLLTLPEQSNGTSEHQFGANMVHEIASDTHLTEIVQAWPQLPEATRSAILAIVRAAAGKEGE